MKGLGKVGKAVGATLAAGAVLAGSLAIGGVVFASGSGTSTKGTAATPRRDGASVRRRPLAGAVHADMTWTMRDGSTRQTSADGGLIASVGSGSITLRRGDGKSVTATVGTAACVRNDGRSATLADLQMGERAVVVQGSGAVLAIRARDGKSAAGGGEQQSTAANPREGCHLLRGVVHGEITVTYKDGSTRHFTYDRGQITSITGSQISFKRPDGQSVTLAYDASTIVREKGRRESVKDLKVGERAMFFSQDGRAVLIRCVSKADVASS